MSPPSRQDVLAEIARRFPSEARTAVVKALNFYGAKPSEPERERVQLAILELSHGDADELRRLVEEAKRDHRSVLRESGGAPAEPAAAAPAAAVPQYEVEGEPAWSYWFIGMCLFIPVFTVEKRCEISTAIFPFVSSANRRNTSYSARASSDAVGSSRISTCASRI